MMLADAPAWHAWANITPIVISARAAGFVRVRMPQGISPGAGGGYDDVRIVDDGGTEVPYALDPARSGSPSRDVPLSDTGFIRGMGTQAVADLGTSRSLEDSITLAIDSNAVPTYFESVDIDASDDLKVWRSVRTSAYVYRVDQDGGRGNQSIAFPPTRSRWLRIRIHDAHAAFPLTGASVATSAAEPPDLLPYTVALQPVPAAAPSDRAWRVDSNVGLRPAAVQFSTKGTFSRPVTIDASDDGTTWSEVGSDSIAAYADGSSQREFAFSERTARHVRITIANGNDAPIDAVPTLLAVPHYAVFAATPGRTYRFVSGNDAASAPSYDLSAKLAHQAWVARAGTGGATHRNPDFVDVRTPPERYPWLLTAAIVAVAVVLGGLAFATIRSAKDVTE